MFKTLFTLFLFAGAAFAQAIYIGSPAENQSVTAGTNLTVQVEQPPTLGDVDTIAITISLESCPNSPCSSGDTGSILFVGPFEPTRINPYSLPSQNFTVEVPASTAIGTASLKAASFVLVGAGLTPIIETANQTIQIVN